MRVVQEGVLQRASRHVLQRVRQLTGTLGTAVLLRAALLRLVGDAFLDCAEDTIGTTTTRAQHVACGGGLLEERGAQWPNVQSELSTSKRGQDDAQRLAAAGWRNQHRVGAG